MTDGAFYFDLGSPLAYLAAERVLHAVPGPLPWIPVLARELPGAESFDAFRCREERDIFRSETERRARDLGLQPLVWPSAFPFDSEPAMRAATYARAIGRAVPFALAAFRQAFAAGRDLSREDWIAVAGAACEMHPRALLTGAGRRNIAEELARTTEAAAAAGVRDVPAVRIGEAVFHGERALEQAGGQLPTPAA